MATLRWNACVFVQFQWAFPTHPALMTLLHPQTPIFILLVGRSLFNAKDSQFACSI